MDKDMEQVSLSHSSSDKLAPLAPARAWWAVYCAGLGLLLSAEEVADVLLPAAISPVPHAPLWLQGITLLQGRCVGVLDLARFLGWGGDESANPFALGELLLLQEACWPGMALRAGRVLGPVRSDELLPAWRRSPSSVMGSEVDLPSFAGDCWDLREWPGLKAWMGRQDLNPASAQDIKHGVWQEIRLNELAQHPRSREWPR